MPPRAEIVHTRDLAGGHTVAAWYLDSGKWSGWYRWSKDQLFVSILGDYPTAAQAMEWAEAAMHTTGRIRQEK